jgi:hypothetical protein
MRQTLVSSGMMRYALSMGHPPGTPGKITQCASFTQPSEGQAKSNLESKVKSALPEWPVKAASVFDDADVSVWAPP